VSVLIRIEHPITDFATWKAAFDSDPVSRKAGGVRAYRILRPLDDPNYVAIDLEFDDAARAASFRDALEGLWRSGRAAAALAGTPRASLVEDVEHGIL
jgi:hypothetical protein